MFTGRGTETRRGVQGRRARVKTEKTVERANRRAVKLSERTSSRNRESASRCRGRRYFSRKYEGVELVSWAGQNRETIDSRLQQHGALLFRGFNSIRSIRFEQFTTTIASSLMSYGERSSPRHVLQRQHLHLDRSSCRSAHTAAQRTVVHAQLAHENLVLLRAPRTVGRPYADRRQSAHLQPSTVSVIESLCRSR